jgi:hypothetical protein
LGSHGWWTSANRDATYLGHKGNEDDTICPECLWEGKTTHEEMLRWDGRTRTEYKREQKEKGEELREEKQRDQIQGLELERERQRNQGAGDRFTRRTAAMGVA